MKLELTLLPRYTFLRATTVHVFLGSFSLVLMLIIFLVNFLQLSSAPKGRIAMNNKKVDNASRYFSPFFCTFPFLPFFSPSSSSSLSAIEFDTSHDINWIEVFC